MAWRALFPLARARWATSLLVGASMPVVATGLRAAINSVIGHSLPFITYFPFLLAAAIWGGARGGAIALIVSTIGAGWFFFPPGDPLRPWALGSFLVSGGVIVAAGALLAEAVRMSRDRQRRLEATDAELRTLVGELAHRSRNALFVLRGIVSQSLRRAHTLAEAEAMIIARLDALGRAQDEVLKAGGGPTPVAALLVRSLEPFDLKRFDIECDAALISANAAPAVCLVANELATNAVKYGALSTDGRVSVRCRRERDTARITWREVGGPKVSPPEAHGFGERLLEKAFEPHRGRAVRRFEAMGVVCEIELPAVTGPVR